MCVSIFKIYMSGNTEVLCMAVVKVQFCTSELPMDKVSVLAKHTTPRAKWLCTLKWCCIVDWQQMLTITPLPMLSEQMPCKCCNFPKEGFGIQPVRGDCLIDGECHQHCSWHHTSYSHWRSTYECMRIWNTHMPFSLQQLQWNPT